MQKMVVSLVFTVFALTSSLAFAGEYDAQWINKCVKDNMRQGQTTETVMKYCECMNSKMSEEETKSITEWEKTHPQEMAECDAKAGWK